MTLYALGTSHVPHGLVLEIWQGWHKNEKMMTYIQKSEDWVGCALFNGEHLLQNLGTQHASYV